MPNASTMTRLERPRMFRRRISNRVLQTASSLLLPLMIAVFTIVTTVIQMNIAKQQREQDLQIAKDNRDKDERIEDSRREKDFEIANQTRILQNQIEENRRLAEDKAQEDQQMNSVLGAYLKEMTELMLLKNFTLADKLIATVIRAKTLTTLGQLDGKRKSHIVRFLNEAQMLGSGPTFVDLTGADLSDVDFTNQKLNNVSFVKCNLFKANFRETELRYIHFLNVQLSAASFINSILDSIQFNETNLTDTSFIQGQIDHSKFVETIVTNTSFTRVKATSNEFIDITGNNTNFDGTHLNMSRFTNPKLINASFVNSDLRTVNMDLAILTKANFTKAKCSTSSFQFSNISKGIFDRSDFDTTSFAYTALINTTWLDANVLNIDFSFANLSGASITDHQIRKAWKTAFTILPNGSRTYDTNLLTNGNAEDLNGNCTINPWHVDSMIADYSIDFLGKIFGKCCFTKPENAISAMMSQRVQVPDQYSEWIRTNMSLIRITGECSCHSGFTMNVRQFNGTNNLPLLNHTYNNEIYLYKTELFFSTHIATTAIELEIIFTGNCSAPSNGFCDNLKLTIWHRNYTYDE